MIPFHVAGARAIRRKLVAVGLWCLLGVSTLGARAGDLTVWFEQKDGDVLITINTWVLPANLSLSTAGSVETSSVYEVLAPQLDPLAGDIKVRHSLAGASYDYAVALFDGGTINFSNLKAAHFDAVNLGSLGGVRLAYNGGGGIDDAVIAFEQYDGESRVATFNVKLRLEGASLAGLFVDPAALAGGGFSVWTSESFDVRFAAVPEPGVVGAAVSGLLLAAVAGRRRRGLRSV